MLIDSLIDFYLFYKLTAKELILVNMINNNILITVKGAMQIIIACSVSFSCLLLLILHVNGLKLILVNINNNNNNNILIST